MAKTTIKEEIKTEKKEGEVSPQVELEKEKEEKEKGKKKEEGKGKGEEKEAVPEKKEKAEVKGRDESKQENKAKAEKAVKLKEEKKEKEIPGEVISGKAAPLEEIISQVEKMTVLELSDLVKALEERFGVVAAAPALAGAVPAVVPGKEAVEKTEWSVILAAVGEKKIQVIKEVRAVTSLGLKEAKTLVEEAPKPVKEGIPQKEAEEIKAKLEAVGATAELK